MDCPTLELAWVILVGHLLSLPQSVPVVDLALLLVIMACLPYCPPFPLVRTTP